MINRFSFLTAVFLALTLGVVGASDLRAQENEDDDSSGGISLPGSGRDDDGDGETDQDGDGIPDDHGEYEPEEDPVPQEIEEDDWDDGTDDADPDTGGGPEGGTGGAGGGDPLGGDGDAGEGDDVSDIGDAEVIEDEVIILTDPAFGPFDDVLPGISVLHSETLDALGSILTVLKLEEGTDLADLALTLAQVRPDAQIAPNNVYRTQAETTVSSLPDRGGEEPSSFASLLRLPAACAAPCRIGLIDTSVDHFHPAMRGAPFEQRHFAGARKANRPSAHGTSVASILIGRDESRFRGLYPEADLHVASVFEFTSAQEVIATTDALILGINWLLEANVGVINMSLTGPANDLLHRAIRRAAEANVPVVAAVGNGGPGGGPRYPAAYEEAIGVTAVDTRLGVFRRAHHGPFVGFAAPGVNILTAGADQSYAGRSGTSFAAPFVSAVIAAGLENSAPAAPAQIVETLRETAVDLGTEGYDPVYGYGLVRGAANQQAALVP